MQPGMPQGRGTIGPDTTPIFTLPGNPVSAYVSFEVFVPPGASASMLGRRDRLPARRCGRVCLERLQLARRASGSSPAASLGGRGRPLRRHARSTGQAQPPRPRPRRYANALIVVPEDVTEVAGGWHR